MGNLPFGPYSVVQDQSYLTSRADSNPRETRDTSGDWHMPFRGSFEHTLDDRGRIAIPAKYRDQFPNNLAVVTPSPEGCLRVFPEGAFQRMSEEFASTPATAVEGRRL